MPAKIEEWRWGGWEGFHPRFVPDTPPITDGTARSLLIDVGYKVVFEDRDSHKILRYQILVYLILFSRTSNTAQNIAYTERKHLRV